MKELLKTLLKNKNLIIIVSILCIMSVVDTFKGINYCKNGLDTVFFIMEIIDIILVMILINNILCMKDNSKCITIKKK